MKTAGYSATPLAKKLGIKDGFVLRLVDPPAYYFDLFEDMPLNIRILDDRETAKNLIHYFTRKADDLRRDIPLLKEEIETNGMIWISWPKKSSRVMTDITEDVIRDLALSNGLVDIKVCAIDQIWSGLKLVVPVKDRVKKSAG